MKFLMFLFIVLHSSLLLAQPQNFGKECSKLREITYQAIHRNFADMIDQNLRSSNGYSANGNWKFATTRYSTTVEWSGALSSTIEHYTDERDSITIKSWQYLADFGVLNNMEQAHDLFVAMRNQIAGCILPTSDSTVLELKPVEAEELPLTMPNEVAVAELFSLPAIPDAALTNSGNEVLPNSGKTSREILLMVALEKTKKGLRPLLIIEAYETSAK